MAIIIDLKIEKLEFEIAGKSFVVNKTDELIDAGDKLRKEVLELGKESEKDQEKTTMLDYRKTIKKGLDLFLGEGAFDYIEEQIGAQYTPKMAEIFFLVYEELQSGIQQDVMPEKYKKPNRKKDK